MLFQLESSSFAKTSLLIIATNYVHDLSQTSSNVGLRFPLKKRQLSKRLKDVVFIDPFDLSCHCHQSLFVWLYKPVHYTTMLFSFQVTK